MINSELHSYDFLKKLAVLPFIKKIILYGSRAREDHRSRSDIDIAIDCSANCDWNKVLEIIDISDTLLKIDCVRIDTLSDDNPLKKSIIRDGKILYEKDEL